MRRAPRDSASPRPSRSGGRLSARLPRGARGPAIDAGAAHGVEERAVRAAVPALDRRPAFGVACESRRVGLFPRHYEIHDNAPCRWRRAIRLAMAPCSRTAPKQALRVLLSNPPRPSGRGARLYAYAVFATRPLVS